MLSESPPQNSRGTVHVVEYMIGLSILTATIGGGVAFILTDSYGAERDQAIEEELSYTAETLKTEINAVDSLAENGDSVSSSVSLPNTVLDQGYQVYIDVEDQGDKYRVIIDIKAGEYSHQEELHTIHTIQPTGLTSNEITLTYNGEKITIDQR